jgi:NAD(P)-dependent dehydrogenase (short-subunit alcohol dehydrogenase family)
MMSKAWLVSGGPDGLGPALSKAALAAGDRVMAIAPRTEPLVDLADRDRERLRVVAIDATDPVGAREAVAAAVAAFGRLDVVVNIARCAAVASIAEIPLEELEAQIASDLWGPIHVTRAALAVMRAQGAGHIVQVCVPEGPRSPASRGAYQAATWGLAGFSEALAAEVAPLGIRVTIVEPDGDGADWAEASAVARRVRARAHAPVGPMARLVREEAAISDEGAAAKALLRIVAEERPPLRLALGGDAVALAEIGACSVRCEQYGR